MPRATNKLTHASLKKTAPGYYADGNGLYLQITQGKDGEPRRSWLCRITVKGVRRELGLGRVQDLPLAKARERRPERTTEERSRRERRECAPKRPLAAPRASGA